MSPRKGQPEWLTRSRSSFPTAPTRQYAAGVTPAEVAASIGRRLAEAAVAATVDGATVDLDRPITADAERGHRHRRLRRGPLRAAPLHRPRAGPGRPRPVPGGQLRHRPADRRRLLLRLRAARPRWARPTSPKPTWSASTPGCGRSCGEAQPFVREEHGPGRRASRSSPTSPSSGRSSRARRAPRAPRRGVVSVYRNPHPPTSRRRRSSTSAAGPHVPTPGGSAPSSS